MVRPFWAPSPWATVGMGLVGMGLALFFTVWYVQAETASRARDICGIIVLIDDRNQQMPPSVDPATAEFRAEVHAYRIKLGC